MQGKTTDEDLGDQLLGEISSSAKEANEDFSVSLSELMQHQEVFQKSLAPLLEKPDLPSEELKESLREFLKNLQKSSNKVESEWERVKDVLDTVSLINEDDSD